MFMATTLNAATFMGKSYSTMQNVVQNEESLTLKQMFDVTAQTIHNEEEIYCLDKIVYQKNSWTQLSLINDPGNDALHVIGLYGLGDSISFFLKDWELAKVALSCHMALDMLCQEVCEALCHSKKSLSLTVDGPF